MSTIIFCSATSKGWSKQANYGTASHQDESDPGIPHWTVAKRILRYLKGTKQCKLTYRRDVDPAFSGYSDADWANDPRPEDAYVSGYVFLKCGGPVSWKSRRQATIAISITGAEYIVFLGAHSTFSNNDGEMEAERNVDSACWFSAFPGKIDFAITRVSIRPTVLSLSSYFTVRLVLYNRLVNKSFVEELRIRAADIPEDDSVEEQRTPTSKLQRRLNRYRRE